MVSRSPAGLIANIITVPAMAWSGASMFGKKKPKVDESLTATYTESDEGVTITLSGRLDSVSSGEFQTEAVSRCGGKPTTMDMEGVTYLSSAGLRAILAIDKSLGSNKLTILNAQGAVKDVLDMSGFSEYL